MGPAHELRHTHRYTDGTQTFIFSRLPVSAIVGVAAIMSPFAACFKLCKFSFVSIQNASVCGCLCDCV